MALTLSAYVARVFSLSVVAMLSALSLLVSLFDFIELLRRSATKPDATFGIVAQIAGLRLPYVSMQILPFAVLLGGILAFWRLTRSSELIVARASGVSAWGFLAAPVGCAILLGAVATGAVSPLSSAMLGRAEVAGQRLPPDVGRTAGAVRRAVVAAPVRPGAGPAGGWRSSMPAASPCAAGRWRRGM